MSAGDQWVGAPEYATVQAVCADNFARAQHAREAGTVDALMTAVITTESQCAQLLMVHRALWASGLVASRRIYGFVKSLPERILTANKLARNVDTIFFDTAPRGPVAKRRTKAEIAMFGRRRPYKRKCKIPEEMLAGVSDAARAILTAPNIYTGEDLAKRASMAVLMECYRKGPRARYVEQAVSRRIMAAAKVGDPVWRDGRKFTIAEVNERKTVRKVRLQTDAGAVLTGWYSFGQIRFVPPEEDAGVKLSTLRTRRGKEFVRPTLERQVVYEELWHYETEDEFGVPRALCGRACSRITPNLRYVTCKKCLQALEDGEI